VQWPFRRKIALLPLPPFFRPSWFHPSYGCNHTQHNTPSDSCRLPARCRFCLVPARRRKGIPRDPHDRGIRDHGIPGPRGKSQPSLNETGIFAQRFWRYILMRPCPWYRRKDDVVIIQSRRGRGFAVKARWSTGYPRKGVVFLPCIGERRWPATPEQGQ